MQPGYESFRLFAKTDLMQYQELQPKAHFSKHVECFWQLELAPDEVENQCELWSPDCTFEMVFSPQALFLQFTGKQGLTKVPAGGAFLGQKTTGARFCTSAPLKLFGIRFKPFAFARLLGAKLSQLNDKSVPIQKLFDLPEDERSAIRRILIERELHEKTGAAEDLMQGLFRRSESVDPVLRAQLNYILDRKGLVQIQDIFREFNVSKVTLHQQFLRNIGLSPKKVSRIWRFNYFLQLQKELPHYNLTQLCLEAGYYDQAHFIKEFKTFFSHCPQHFFKNESQMLRISQEIIARRFTNKYDPR